MTRMLAVTHFFLQCGAIALLCAGSASAADVPPCHRFLTHSGMEFTLIPGGKFIMGGSGEDGPLHEVTLSKFYVARSGVTKGIFRQFLRETKRAGDRDELGPDPNGWAFVNLAQWNQLPGVFKSAPLNDDECRWQSWIDADAFAQWMSKREKRTFELITEAQYEYVSRSGVAMGDQSFWWESTQPSALACWLNDPNYAFTGPELTSSLPGLYTMTPWGIHLMVTRYWVRDRMGEYPDHAVVNPTGPLITLNSERVFRGAFISNRSSSPPDSQVASILLVSKVTSKDCHMEEPAPPSVQPPLLPSEKQ